MAADSTSLRTAHSMDNRVTRMTSHGESIEAIASLSGEPSKFRNVCLLYNWIPFGMMPFLLRAKVRSGVSRAVGQKKRSFRNCTEGETCLSALT